jgi:hypothetical protein
MKSGARRGVEQGPTALNYNPDFRHFNLGRAAYGGILMLTRERLLRDEILTLMLGGLHERHVVQHGIWERTQIA